MTTRPGYVWDEAASEFVGIGQAAVLAPIAYQASQPSSPATGDIWIDSDDDVPSVDSTLYYRWTKTMSGGETSLSGNDNNSLSLRYTPGYESVFINGVLQGRNLDYTATSGSTIAGLTALASNDIVMVESIVAYSVGDTYTQAQIGSLLDAKSPVSTTGIVLINSTDFSSVANITLDNCFSSSYKNYKLIMNCTPSTPMSINLQFRTPGVSPSTDSSSNYGHTVFAISSGSTTLIANAYQAAALTQARIFDALASHNEAYVIEMDFFSPHDATVKTSGVHVASRSNAGSTHAIYLGGIMHNATTSFGGMYLAPNTGTITGTIKVYGYK